MVITEKVSDKNIPVVYWFMLDEHFLVWLDILFIYSSRLIKFSNMKWEKNIWDGELHHWHWSTWQNTMDCPRFVWTILYASPAYNWKWNFTFGLKTDGNNLHHNGGYEQALGCVIRYLSTFFRVSSTLGTSGGKIFKWQNNSEYIRQDVWRV